MKNDIIREAQLGLEASKFKSSSLGLYLYDKAELEIMEATIELTTTDPTNAKEITKLQNQVYVANSFIAWIEEAIENGNFAENELRSED